MLPNYAKKLHMMGVGCSKALPLMLQKLKGDKGLLSMHHKKEVTIIYFSLGILTPES